MDEESTTGDVYGEKIKVCQITDTGGIDGPSFNETAWKGAEDAVHKICGWKANTLNPSNKLIMRRISPLSSMMVVT